MTFYEARPVHQSSVEEDRGRRDRRRARQTHWIRPSRFEERSGDGGVGGDFRRRHQGERHDKDQHRQHLHLQHHRGQLVGERLFRRQSSAVQDQHRNDGNR